MANIPPFGILHSLGLITVINHSRAEWCCERCLYVIMPSTDAKLHVVSDTMVVDIMTNHSAPGKTSVIHP